MNKDLDLNDDLSDLLGNAGPVAAPKAPPASYQQPTDFKSVNEYVTETCPKCNGTGRFVGFTGRDMGQCHTCRGKGKRMFKSTREQRAKATTQRTARKASTQTSNLTEFKATYPAVYDWLLSAGRPGFDFPASMLAAIAKYGYLTDKQLATCERLSARATESKAQAQARIEAAPVVDTAGIDRLKLAFDKAAAFTAAKAKGLTVRNPKITIGGMTISPAKAHGKNPGALYVKDAGNYIGKVVDGKFVATLNCTPAQIDKVFKFIADPAEAAKVYGQETGVCCVCNAELRSEWRLRGIGPICAEKFGW
jgi:hypothetical protein